MLNKHSLFVFYKHISGTDSRPRPVNLLEMFRRQDAEPSPSTIKSREERHKEAEQRLGLPFSTRRFQRANSLPIGFPSGAFAGRMEFPDRTLPDDLGDELGEACRDQRGRGGRVKTFHRISSEPERSGRSTKSPRFESPSPSAITDLITVGGRDSVVQQRTHNTIIALTTEELVQYRAGRDSVDLSAPFAMMDTHSAQFSQDAELLQPGTPEGHAAPEHNPITPTAAPTVAAVTGTPKTPDQAATDQAKTRIQIPIEDKVESFLPPYIVSNYDEIRDAAARGPILIRCTMGVSRSVSFTIGTLIMAYHRRELSHFGAEHLKANLAAAESSEKRVHTLLSYLHERRPCAGPKPWFIYQLLLLDSTLSTGDLTPASYSTTQAQIDSFKATALLFSDQFKTLPSIEDGDELSMHMTLFLTHSSIYKGMIVQDPK